MNKPGPGNYGSIVVKHLDDDWIEIFNTDDIFKRFRSQNRVSIIDNELWVYEDDSDVIKFIKSL